MSDSKNRFDAFLKASKNPTPLPPLSPRRCPSDPAVCALIIPARAAASEAIRQTAIKITESNDGIFDKKSGELKVVRHGRPIFYQVRKLEIFVPELAFVPVKFDPQSRLHIDGDDLPPEN